MPIRRSITREGSSEARAALIENAAAGELPWPEAIQQMRLSLGKTQQEFGALFGLSRRRVNALEAGHANPTAETLMRIGHPFGLTVGFVPRSNVKPKTSKEEK